MIFVQKQENVSLMMILAVLVAAAARGKITEVMITGKGDVGKMTDPGNAILQAAVQIGLKGKSNAKLKGKPPAVLTALVVALALESTMKNSERWWISPQSSLFTQIRH